MREMLKFASSESVLLKLPEGVRGDVRIAFKEFRRNGAACTAVIINDTTYRVVCREDSNALVVKDGADLLRVKMGLECVEMERCEEDVAEMVPEIRLDTIDDEKHYLPRDRLEIHHPMSETEHKKLVKKLQLIKISKKGKEYVGRVEQKLLLDVLLLTRSLLISNMELKREFEEIFPRELFQIVENYVENEKVNQDALNKDIITLLKKTSASEQEFIRSMKINGMNMGRQAG